MATSLRNLFGNLAEGIHKTKCKDCDCFLEYESFKDNLIKYKYLSYNKNYPNKIDEELKKRLKNTYTLSNNDIYQFILLLREGVYPYECRMIWKSLMKQRYLKKKSFIAS